MLHVHDSRSKFLYPNLGLGVSQPTHLHDFSFSLCGVTQGNPAKHKLGARLAQVFPCIFLTYDVNLIHCMYIDFIIKVFPNMLFVSLSAAVSEYVNPAG